MLKKFISGIMILIFTSSVFTFILVASFVLLFRPGNIKEWVRESGIYSTLSTNIINQGIRQQASSNVINFDDPAVQSAAKLALSPKFIESSSETIIDSLFSWLGGSSDKLTFTIETDPIKKVFADDIISYATKRYNSLPTCAYNTAPTSTNPLTINCRPPYGVDINQLTSDLRVQIMQNEDFLPNGALTSDTIFGNSSSNNPVLGNQSALPKIYRYLQIAPYILGFSLLLAASSAIALNESRRRTASKIGSIMIITSILAMIALWLSSFAISAIKVQLLLQQNSDSANSFGNIIVSILNALRIDMLKTAGTISLVFASIGVIILITIKVITKKKKIPKLPVLKPAVPEKLASDKSVAPKNKNVKMVKPKQQTAPLIIKPESTPANSEIQPTSPKKQIQ